MGRQVAKLQARVGNRSSKGAEGRPREKVAVRGTADPGVILGVMRAGHHHRAGLVGHRQRQQALQFTVGRAGNNQQRFKLFPIDAIPRADESGALKCRRPGAGGMKRRPFGLELRLIEQRARLRASDAFDRHVGNAHK